MWPLAQAYMRGVHPFLSFASLSAPVVSVMQQMTQQGTHCMYTAIVMRKSFFQQSVSLLPTIKVIIYTTYKCTTKQYAHSCIVQSIQVNCPMYINAVQMITTGQQNCNKHTHQTQFCIVFITYTSYHYSWREWACQVWSVRTGCTVQRQWCNGPQWLPAVAFLNNQ